MTIKIVSLNIWIGGVLLWEAIDFLKKQNADLLIMQEVFSSDNATLDSRNRTLQILQEELGLSYTNFLADFNQPLAGSEIGNAILSRFPIKTVTENAEKRYNNFYNLQHVVLKTSKGDIDVVNIHGVWDLNGDRFSRHRKEMTVHIMNTIRGRSTVILAGDTNVKPTNRAISIINKQLRSVSGGELTTTFNMKRKVDQGYASAAVDMIFVSPNIDIIRYECPSVDVSDHLPLVATLQINS